VLGSTADDEAIDVDDGVYVAVADLTVLDSDTVLSDIRDLRWSDGYLWALSRFEPNVAVFSSDGRLVASFGVRGQGPGEFGTPWSLVLPAEADSADMYVWDAGDKRLEGFVTSGAFTGGVPLAIDYGSVLTSFETSYYGEPLRVRRFGSSLVIGISSGLIASADHLWSSTLTELSSTGGSREIAAFSNFFPQDHPEMPRALGPVPLWTACGRESVAIFDPFSGDVRVVTAAGMNTTTYSTHVPRPPIGEADVRRWVEMSLAAEAHEIGFDPDPAQFRQIVEGAVADLVGQVPSNASPVSIRCDPAGQLWLQGFSTETDPRGYGSTWYGMEPQRVVEFPPGFRPLDFQNARVYGVFTDDLGVQRIGWVERAGW